MKIIAFNGSPRENGNTSIMLNHLFSVLNEQNIETEEIRMGHIDLRTCKACGACRNGHKLCIQDDDPLNMWVEKLHTAQGLVLASPTYFGTVTGAMKNLIDRLGYVAKPQGLLHHKVGAAIVVARRGGAVQTYNTLMSFFSLMQMVVPMSDYWNITYGRDKGDVNNDLEGVNSIKTLGNNMAWLMHKLY